MTIGWTEGRNPSALFDTNYYLNQNPDVKAARINPLAHFEAWGRKEGRDPSLTVSVSKYLATNPDVASAGFDPVAFRVAQRAGRGRAIDAVTPHAAGPQDPLVDAAHVYAHDPAVAGLDASACDNGVGRQEGADSDAYFGTN